MSPRHILTPEERARGHKLTHADRVRGGRNVPRAKRGGKPSPERVAKLIELGTKYRITSANARAMAARSAQVRRERRAQALITLALPAKRDSESREPRQGEPDDVAIIDGQVMVGEIKSAGGAYAMGASLAGKLMAGEAQRLEAEREALAASAPKPPACDPFTLSALKRFRLGPKSPLHLTRSQRAQVDVMIAGGWLMATGDSMLALTEKGWQAVDAEVLDELAEGPSDDQMGAK